MKSRNILLLTLLQLVLFSLIWVSPPMEPAQDPIVITSYFLNNSEVIMYRYEFLDHPGSFGEFLSEIDYNIGDTLNYKHQK